MPVANGILALPPMHSVLGTVDLQGQNVGQATEHGTPYYHPGDKSSLFLIL